MKEYLITKEELNNLLDYYESNRWGNDYPKLIAKFLKTKLPVKVIGSGVVSIEHSYEDDEDTILIDKTYIGSLLGDLCYEIEKLSGESIKIILEVIK
jgi:hypothetical protein